jgi:hypothetical protein
MIRAAVDRASVLHSETREELARADAKATTLLSVTGLIIGALLAGAIAGDWTPQKLDNTVEWAFWPGLLLIAAAEGALFLAVVPRIKHDKDKKKLRYFGHVVQFRDLDDLREALETADSEHDRLLDQVFVLAGIAETKFRFVWVGMVGLTTGSALCAAAVLLNTLTPG